MRNFISSFFAFFCLISVSFSQTNSIEKGTYISTNKGQKIKLNLLDNNKYELVFYSGEYKIKGDSLLFSQEVKTDDSFNLAFKNDKKAKKIKIKFLEPSYYSLYIGTQKGSEPVQYQKVSDLKTKVDPDWINPDLEFEIEKTDYLYLVYEGYDSESRLYKYALPKDVSEVTIKYELDVLGDLNITGIFDRKTNELKISEQKGKNPLVFLNEKETPEVIASKVLPIEKQTISNWTYPGKEILLGDDFGTVADSSAVTVDSAYASPKINFKFKIESSLKEAIAATKNAKTKFLVVYTDSKNPSAKADFDAFVKEQEVQVGYNMYDVYDPQYDIFNYYLATADDKKWLKANKINDNPSVIVLNGEGDVLTSAKSTLNDQKAKFNYYDEFCKKVQRVNAFNTFNKVVKNKKATDVDLIAAFNRAAVLELPYDYESDYEVAVAAENNTVDFKLPKTALDKKEVSQTWKKLIEAHQKDTKPNMLLVETILKEIKNQGFSKQFFKEDRVLNDTDFLSIDYLIKHYDAIEKARSEVVDATAPAVSVTNLSGDISSALQINSYVSQEGVEGTANQDKIISIYKKLIAIGKGGFECYKNYFAYLSQDSDESADNTAFLKEFNTYFNTYLSTEKGNVIETLDQLFATIDANSEYSYNGWNSFKEYHSNLANTAAWSVVEKPANAAFIKTAILWSEYSLAVTKNNPYYLDTLAQLYYKDGQKEKAIELQKKALQYSATVYEPDTLNDMKAVLEKMQNGTY
ncbi:CDC27 family protein [Flavobacterium sp. CLA17]|uniref:CDC27 family protein n=1 Tax=Flavobacterium sp. CLA17 TaxID=2724135 RepID=UPI0014911FFF|nr:CDC27 family protein [Flavobacterium sp. CLA17]QSB26910.1 CDC27 family protein [Flavobacterium sp. CLA17]